MNNAEVRTASCRDVAAVFVQARAGIVVRENLLKRLSALGHDVRAFLAKAQTVAKATPAKYKLRASSRNVEARAFQIVPAERATHDQLEFPAAYRLLTISSNHDELGAPGLIVSCDRQLAKVLTDICPWIAAQCVCQLSGVDDVSPAVMRASVAVVVAN